jgi:hypothetical protein
VIAIARHGIKSGPEAVVAHRPALNTTPTLEVEAMPEQNPTRPDARYHKRNWRTLPEHWTWVAMRTRCNCPTYKDYAYYGGRGIRVCDRWQTSFENFLADMGPRPSSRHTLDRIDNNGNYEPGNCRWATWKEQSRNKRNSIYVEFEGERITVDELSHRTKIPVGTLHGRHKSGAPLLEPGRLRGESHPLTSLTVADVIDIRSSLAAGASMAEMSRKYGVTPPAIRAIRDRRTWKHVPEQAAVAAVRSSE